MSDEYGHKMRGAFAAFNHLRYFFGYLGLNGRSGLFSVEYVHLYEVQNRKFKGFGSLLVRSLGQNICSLEKVNLIFALSSSRRHSVGRAR